MRRKFIGLSLSLCLQDILAGNIEVKEIAGIMTSTAFENLHQAFEYYYPIYWNNYDKTETFKKFTEVWPLVCQPRQQVGMFEHRGHKVTHGFWLNTETGELTHHLNERKDNSIQGLPSDSN